MIKRKSPFVNYFVRGCFGGEPLQQICAIQLWVALHPLLVLLASLQHSVILQVNLGVTLEP